MDSYLVKDGKLVKEIPAIVRETYSLENIESNLTACQDVIDKAQAEKTRILALKAKAIELGVKPVEII